MVTTVCPCSLEISDRGAHNQRGEVRARVRFKRIVWIEQGQLILNRFSAPLAEKRGSPRFGTGHDMGEKLSQITECTANCDGKGAANLFQSDCGDGDTLQSR